MLLLFLLLFHLHIQQNPSKHHLLLPQELQHLRLDQLDGLASLYEVMGHTSTQNQPYH